MMNNQSLSPLPPWTRRDNFGVVASQRVIRTINEGIRRDATADLRLERTRRIIAYITDHGPNGEADFDNEIYWVQLVDVEPVTDADTDGISRIKFTDEPAAGEVEAILPAINFGEQPVVGSEEEGTHTLEYGRVVELSVYERVDSTTVFEFFGFSVGSILPVGQYQHQIYGMVVNNGAGWEMPLAVPALNEVETGF